MSVIASISTSVDGYYAGPDDGPGCGLGVGGERLHWWVFGGPWTYDAERGFDEGGEVDKAFIAENLLSCGAVVCGRGTYDAAGAWGGSNPWDVPLFVVTHRVEDQPAPEAGFTFVPDLATGLERAAEAAGDKDVNLMGGGSVIAQALAAGARGRAGAVDLAGAARPRQAALRRPRARPRPGEGARLGLPAGHARALRGAGLTISRATASARRRPRSSAAAARSCARSRRSTSGRPGGALITDSAVETIAVTIRLAITRRSSPDQVEESGSRARSVASSRSKSSSSCRIASRTTGGPPNRSRAMNRKCARCRWAWSTRIATELAITPPSSRVALAHRRAASTRSEANDCVDQREPELVERGEVPVERGRHDADLAGDLAQRQRRQAAVVGEPQRRVEDRLPGALLALLPGSPRAGSPGQSTAGRCTRW